MTRLTRTRSTALLLALLLLVGATADPGALHDQPAGPVRLLVPPVIQCVPGVEANVYFDNVTLVVNPANYAFDVTCEKGMQQAERWTFTPTEKDVGEHPFTLEVRDQTNAVIATARSTVKVVPADAGAGGHECDAARQRPRIHPVPRELYCARRPAQAGLLHGVPCFWAGTG